MLDQHTHTIVTNALEESQSYQIQNMTFVVTPVFPTQSKDTLGAALLRLMKAGFEEA